MKLKSLFAIATTLLLQVSCSSKNGDSSANPAPKGNESGTPEGNSADGNAGSNPSFLWLSDKEQVFIEPCKIGQVMVDAQCWDEVHFSPNGVSLSRSDSVFTVFENGAETKEYLKSQYSFEGEPNWTDGFVVNNSLPKKSFKNLAYKRIENWFLEDLLEKKALQVNDHTAPFKLIFDAYYGLTPRRISFSAAGQETSLEKAKLAYAEFRLILTGIHPDRDLGYVRHAWRMKGTLEACGQIVRLESVTQGQLEKICNKQTVGTQPQLILPIPNGLMRIDFSLWTNSQIDDLPGAIIYDLNFPDPTKATPPPAEPTPENKITEVLQ